jgi:hypothetical protein
MCPTTRHSTSLRGATMRLADLSDLLRVCRPGDRIEVDAG